MLIKFWDADGLINPLYLLTVAVDHHIIVA